MDIKTHKEIKKDLSECFMQFGDNPKDLAFKLELTIIEWYCKGVNAGIENERKHGKR